MATVRPGAPEVPPGWTEPRVGRWARVLGAALAAVYRPTYLSIAYHLVSDEDVAHVRHTFPYKSQAQLRADLEYLSTCHGLADPAPFAESPAPHASTRGQALLTFDDGYREWGTVVQPILESLSCRAVFFVSTDTIENQRLLPQHRASLIIARLLEAPAEELPGLLLRVGSVLGVEPPAVNACAAHLRRVLSSEEAWRLRDILGEMGVDEVSYLRQVRPYLTEEDLRGLSARGFVIGAHGTDHARLSSASPEEIERQVVESCARIRAITRQELVPFAATFTSLPDLSLLASLRTSHPFVGAYFGARGIWPRPFGFYERIVADWQWGTRPGDTNLPRIISHAYATAARAGVQAIGRQLRRRSAPSPGSVPRDAT
jgi:peptidoglycan/xylan/chitin deacetylase (PgdA/CDA1 family)